ncbi:MAG: beta-N-acetylglucosaminidase domain-containing protein, partial [Alloprevotella sp.]|nr:beta-N-acetylglucosaminidase domain-containing protein [Alloprevotella sp.]
MKVKVFAFTLFAALHVSTWADKVYTIYPIPHEQVAVTGNVTFTQTVSIQAEDGIDNYTRDRAAQVLSEHGLTPSFENVAGASVVYLGVNGSGGAADQMATTLGLKRDVFGLNKYDRHILSLTDAGSGNARLVIVGENTDATFCGLASLEQMLDAGPTLPCVQIYDYADIKDRGVIEGYYGVPYSAEVTKDLFRFMARYKMNMYMYGAKSDPYHSQYWGDPYPTSITEEQRQIGYLTQDMLKEITAVGHATKVNFIWAIHPGTAFTNADNTSVIDNIMQKFRFMHQLGVRQFGVFVDDVGVPTDDATLKLNASRLTQLQNRIDALWNRPTAAPADTVKPLHFVPQLYALGWAGDNDR